MPRSQPDGDHDDDDDDHNDTADECQGDVRCVSCIGDFGEIQSDFCDTEAALTSSGAWLRNSS